MQPGAEPSAERQSGSRTRLRVRIAATAVLIIALSAGGIFVLSGRVIDAPNWLLSRVEGQLNAALAARGHLSIGGLEVRLALGKAPRLGLRDVRFFAPGLEGRRWWGAAALAATRPQPLLHLPKVYATVNGAALLARQLQPERLHLDGGTVTVRRLDDGRFDLAMGGALAATGRLPDILDAVDATLSGSLGGQLERLEADNLSAVLEDARTGRTWRGIGSLTLAQSRDRTEATVTLDVPGVPGQRGQISLDFASLRNSPEASINVRFANLLPGDIAAHSPALAWLSAIDASVAGHVSAQIDRAGTVSEVEGGLSLGRGELQPTDTIPPLSVDAAQIAFAFDAASGRVSIQDLKLDSPTMRLEASGNVTFAAPGPTAVQPLLGQFRISKLTLDPAGGFTEPLTFDQGVVDLRLAVDPFRVDLGQATLQREAGAIEVRGHARAAPDGWHAAIDARAGNLGRAQLFELWPLELAPGTRRWLAENLIESHLSNVFAGMRLAPGARPDIALGFDFEDAKLRVMPTLPLLTDARGHASLHDRAFTLSVGAGQFQSPDGGPVALAGTMFRIPDTSQRPAQAHLTLRTESTITAALSLLDQPPFAFLSKSGRAVDLAEGRARIQADIAMPLVRPITADLVKVAATGTLTDVRSEKLMPGRELVSDALSLSLSDHKLEIGGAGALDDVPFRATWSRGTRPGEEGESHVVGTLELSQQAAHSFGLKLPAGSLGGTATGQIMLDLQRDAPPQFSMQSDLVGLGLRLDALGWSKPAPVAGRLEVAGRLGVTPTVDRISLRSPGLSVTGMAQLLPTGGLERASFSRVQVGGWLDAAVELTGRGRGSAPNLAVVGGTVDLRLANLAAGREGRTQGYDGADQVLTVALDRLVISEGIALTGFRGRFDLQGGMTGSFNAFVNGEAPVSGVIAPGAGGRSALRVRGNDAGAVFRAAGVFGKAHDGLMDLVLSPRGGAGEYDGRLQVRDTRVRQAPVLADLLGAISVVGLLEQLNGQGLVFSDVAADFRLTPQAIEVISASATGNSLGISLAGVYELSSKRMEMQGVISPIYMLNAIGGVFSPRPGEGLFGVNYRLSGSAVRPQVSVNPLSVFAPGGLREVFRGALPRISQ